MNMYVLSNLSDTSIYEDSTIDNKNKIKQTQRYSCA